jgi:hypothetical protein
MSLLPGEHRRALQLRPLLARRGEASPLLARQGGAVMTSQPAIALEQVPIDSLRPDPANPRRISDAELEALTRSLREYGFIQPVIARRKDNAVIGGHQRKRAFSTSR